MQKETEVVISRPKTNCKLGSFLPSLDLLDANIDTCLTKQVLAEIEVTTTIWFDSIVNFH